MSERIRNVAEFKAMNDDGKPLLGNGGSVGKHDSYPPSLDLAYGDEERLPPAELVLRREQRLVSIVSFVCSFPLVGISQTRSPEGGHVGFLEKRHNGDIMLICIVAPLFGRWLLTGHALPGFPGPYEPFYLKHPSVSCRFHS